MGLLDRLLGAPSKDKFAILLRDAIRKAGEAGEIVYDREGYRLHDGEAGSRTAAGVGLYHATCLTGGATAVHWGERNRAPAGGRPVEFHELPIMVDAFAASFKRRPQTNWFSDWAAYRHNRVLSTSLKFLISRSEVPEGSEPIDSDVSDTQRREGLIAVSLSRSVCFPKVLVGGRD